MRLAYDREADSAYLYLKEPVKKGEVKTTSPGEGEAGGINLDFDGEGRLLGIEVLEASRRLPQELLRRAK